MAAIVNNSGSDFPPGASEAPAHVLCNASFRRTWLASLSSNLGIHIMVATAAWLMKIMTDDPERVAMVQTAFLLPVLLFGFLSGPVADTFEKRRIMFIAGLVMALASFAAWMGDRGALLQPLAILFLCFALGSGQAFFIPALQTSIRQYLPHEQLPQAISLNSISFNIGRSVGPAIGGALIAAAGTAAGFVAPFFAMLPIIGVSLFSPPEKTDRSYRERLGDAVGSGVRYIINSPVILNCQFRALIVSCCTSVMAALAPFIATDILGAGASAYGGLLAAFGFGSITGALLIERIRKNFGAEALLHGLLAIGAAGCGIVSVSPVAGLSMFGFYLVGLAHMGSITLLNIIGQLHSAQWAAARVFSSYFSFSAGGLAGSSILWGVLAAHMDTSAVMGVATGVFCLAIGLSLLAPVSFPSGDAVQPGDPLPLRWPAEALAPRDGPIVVEIQFSIDDADRELFLEKMAKLAQSHARIGFRNWTLTRSVENPSAWRMRFMVKTWADYLNYRTRMTVADREIIEALHALHRGPDSVQVFISVVVRPAMESA
ncbi:MFS transporter [Hyphococcus luteus]|uniref:Major facilitator superfamily (MFS) profile domain-containing protein n=1 Tax=Hyphococcus luteus TaxID=2058213 RepID=A0A2S7K1P3_9PROT|nr:MFS transporter [Marinicaulis flavus]PQA86422.1 hypothetical protein CW354_19015 [Marinicaulis flavus]